MKSAGDSSGVGPGSFMCGGDGVSGLSAYDLFIVVEYT